ncbi:MAG: alpha/beta hydrolase [Minwuiales bacterium]|nr:alpha/beta hydrolase [Minwuiales bacterium]
MESVIRLVVIAAVGYLVILCLMFAFQRSLLYLPGKTLPGPAMAGVPDMTPVTLNTADGLALTAWYKAPPPGRPVIVLFHGNAGTIAHRGFKARFLIDSGHGMLLAPYRGYGGNPGKPTEEGLYADGRAALAFLAEQGIAADQLVLFGESLGGGVAVQLATETDIAALILEAPFTSVPDVAAAHYFYLPVRPLAKDRFESIDKIGKVRAPILVFQGEDDEVVPVRFGKALFEAAPEPKQSVFLPNARHNDLYNHGAADVVLRFLRETFP